MELKKHLNNISVLALASLCLFSSLYNEPKQATVNAIGDTYQAYSETISFSYSERNSESEFVSNLTVKTTFNCNYKVYADNIYIDGVTLDYEAYFYDENQLYELNGVYNAPLNNEVYVKSIDDLNSLYFKVYLVYFDGEPLSDAVLGIDFVGRQASTNGVYIFNNISYTPSFNYFPTEEQNTKLITVITSEVNAYNYGFTQGETVGYNEGYSNAESMTFEQHGFEMLLNSIFSAPAYMFATAFNFEIFGINVKNILLLFLTIGLVIMAIGIFKSKE